jgi:hypothetical protein
MEEDNDESTDDGSIDLSQYWEDVINQLEDADGDPVQTGRTADAFCEKLATAVDADDATKTTADAFLGRFAKLAGIKKSKVEQTYEDKLSDLRKPEEKSDDGDDDDHSHRLGPLNFFIQDHLSELIIYNPEDVSVDAKYVWQFKDPDIRVETEREHLASNTMQEAIFVASGSQYSADSTESLNENWMTWIMALVARCKSSGMAETQPLDGERSEAVRSLKNQIENTPATMDLHEAVQQYRPHVESEESEEVIVPKPIIERVMSDFENVQYRDLQIELDERDYRARNNSNTTVGRGQTVSLWHFNRDWLDIEVDVPEDDEESDDSNETKEVVSGETA